MKIAPWILILFTLLTLTTMLCEARMPGVLCELYAKGDGVRCPIVTTCVKSWCGVPYQLSVKKCSVFGPGTEECPTPAPCE